MTRLSRILRDDSWFLHVVEIGMSKEKVGLSKDVWPANRSERIFFARRESASMVSCNGNWVWLPRADGCGRLKHVGPLLRARLVKGWEGGEALLHWAGGA